MAEFKIFTSSEFGLLGAMVLGGKPCFPAQDCARILGYGDLDGVLMQHCLEVAFYPLPYSQDSDKIIEAEFISKGDLSRLIFHSPLIKEKACRFERWVFDVIAFEIMLEWEYGEIPKYSKGIMEGSNGKL